MPEADTPAARVGRLVATRPPRLGSVRLVTLDGPSGSGKSTLAGDVVGALVTSGWDALSVSTDLLATWDDPFGWWPVLERGLLVPLAAGRPGLLDRMDWSSGEPVPGDPLPVRVPQVLVLEGVSSGRRDVVDRTSVAVWVEVPDRVQRLERAVARDGEASRPFLRRWPDQEEAHFRTEGTRARADLVIRPDDRSDPLPA